MFGRPLFRAIVSILTLLVTTIGYLASPQSAQPTAIPPTTLAAATSASYWVANPNGQVWNFGAAADYGDLGSITPNKPIIGMTPTTSNSGYWLVASDGGIFSFGDAKFHGSTGSIKLNKPIVGMAPTPSGKGYWMVASDGGIFSYGDAQFYGSTGSIKLNKPIVGMTPTPSGKGYWLIATDGGVFCFGDAPFHGSTGSFKLNKPITSMTAMPGSTGYWMVASDGGIFAFGAARFYGSAGGTSDNSFVRIESAPDGKGYWLIRNGGGSIAYGTAMGSIASSANTAGRPVIGLVYNITGPYDLAVLWAMSQSGKPYVWGGNGPDGYDCSGLVQQAWIQGGITLPRVANDQYDFRGRSLPLSEARAGDLVFWGKDPNDPRSVYHVAIYVGGNNVIMAPKPGDVVRTAPIWTTELMPYVIRPRP